MPAVKSLQSFAVAALLLTAGCSLFSKRLPPVNLGAPGWTVRQGQAVWTMPRHGHQGTVDLAGEVIVAMGPEGKTFVQFSKSPFPLLTGQTAPHHWQVELPPQNKHYSGPGSPPRRLIWLYLPSILTGKPPPPNWSWSLADGNWRLENARTGEKIEGFFAQ